MMRLCNGLVHLQWHLRILHVEGRAQLLLACGRRRCT